MTQLSFGLNCEPIELVSTDGIATLYPLQSLFTDDQRIYEELKQQLEWDQHYVQLYGKRIACPRLSAWYGDKNAVYQYSGVTYHPHHWTKQLLELRNIVQEISGAEYNSCLANWYRSGHDGMGWHADNEPELGGCPTIASLSFGETRRFSLRHIHKRYDTVKVNLSTGDLLVMRGTLQANWQHSISKTAKVVSGRINLTFRYINPKDTK